MTNNASQEQKNSNSAEVEKKAPSTSQPAVQPETKPADTTQTTKA